MNTKAGESESVKSPVLQHLEFREEDTNLSASSWVLCVALAYTYAVTTVCMTRANCECDGYLGYQA